MPFGLFVGVYNHFQSIILGGVLLRDETTETFEWVFKEFVSLMGFQAPKTILTYQARAMEKAISSQWPDTTHRWCKWHVLQKAREIPAPEDGAMENVMLEIALAIEYVFMPGLCFFW
ncbi:hypothetical protein ACQJBY_001502 [Aegilops geniculata]